MINHVVLFKLKDYPVNEKEIIAGEIKTMLEELQGKIFEVKFIEVGINIVKDSKNYDLALISYFETEKDLDAYREHPEHLKVAERIKESIVERAAVDYYF
jgi:uncharacterized protein (UPF0335 family)